MLHYRASGWHIGDVHPYFENGRLYLFYLVPNGILRCDACFTDPSKVVTKRSAVSFTDDFIHWHEYLLPDIILNIVKINNVYYSCVGSGERSFYESRDLVHWEPSSEFRFDIDEKLFTAGARDYACFWDDDTRSMRVSANAYFTNEHRGIEKGLDCCVLISQSINSSGDSPQRVLLDMRNMDRPLMKCKEPECNQMIRISDRWYLVTSLARQTVHWVGPPSYWIGDRNRAIDDQDWQSKEEYRLDGEDLCAAQIAPCGNKNYIFGWIPLNYNGQEWGGDLNLPREVYPLEDGRLASGLDKAYAEAIRGEVHDFVPRLMDSQIFGFCMQIQPLAKDFGVRMTICDMNKRAGILLDTESGICVQVSEHKIGIVKLKENEARFVFAELEIDAASSERSLHVLFDGDIVEAFLDDRYAVCARVDACHQGGDIVAFTDAAHGLSFLEVYTFSEQAVCSTSYGYPDN